ncbi:hypothetical protein KIPB_014812, partial [Kipferlia bialata]|eukprot:g14812.t1
MPESNDGHSCLADFRIAE